MKRTLLRRALPGLLAGALLLTACADTTAEQAAPTAEPARPTSAAAAGPLPVPTEGSMRLSDGTVVANGRVLPAQVISMSFEIAGVFSDLQVKPGDAVTAGQVLGSLDTRQLALRVDEARAQLAEARAAYEQLTAGVGEADLQRAQAQIDAAQARLAAEANEVTAKDLEAAEARLREARASAAQLSAGPLKEDIALLQSQVDVARSRLDTRRDALAAEKLRVELQVERAANDLRVAQDNYSRVYWANQNGGSDGSTLTQDEIDAEALAKRVMENAEARLGEVQLTLEEARKREATELETYQAELRQAETRLNRLLLPADQQAIARADRLVAEAQAELERLKGLARQNNLDALSAEVRQAEATLADLLADPRTSDLAIAEARIARAEVGLKQAELDVEQASLRAPISGVVADIDIEPGQVVNAGIPVLVLADTSSWRIATADLNEMSVSQVREGDEVTITFFAAPDLRLAGKVSYIETIGRESGLGTSYTVFITPDSWDERLRWNMSAQVTFAPLQQ